MLKDHLVYPTHQCHHHLKQNSASQREGESPGTAIKHTPPSITIQIITHHSFDFIIIKKPFKMVEFQ